jgi:hypothetical protein
MNARTFALTVLRILIGEPLVESIAWLHPPKVLGLGMVGK